MDGDEQSGWTRNGAEDALAAVLPAGQGRPFVVQDATVLTFSVTFRPEAISRHLPRGLQPAGEATGGVEFLLARRGGTTMPFTTTTVWIDLASPRPDLVAPRYAAARFASEGRGAGQAVTRAQTRFSEACGQVSAELSVDGCGILRAGMQPGRSVFAAAGVTTYLSGAARSKPAEIVPWSAMLCDAEPLMLHIEDPALADFAPVTVFGATLASDAALAFGICSSPVETGLLPQESPSYRRRA